MENLTLKSHVIKADVARQIRDPFFHSNNHYDETDAQGIAQPINISKHIFIVNINDVPSGISNEPNARKANVKKQTYKRVRESLEMDDGRFHLKNKGIVIIAESVEKITNDNYRIKIGTDQGIIDGGHTYTLIQETIENDKQIDQQYVTIEVRTGIPFHMIPEIAGGLNTAVQVADHSLDDKKGYFDWIKEEFKHKKFSDKIAWSENDDGDYGVRDIIALMTLFNIYQYPNDRDSCPVMAYSGKGQCLKFFENNQKQYKFIKPILLDILELYEYIIFNAQRYCREAGFKNIGGLRIVNYIDTQNKKKQPFKPVFSDIKESHHNLKLCVAVPILGAFRWFVEENKNMDGDLRWKMPFQEVLDFCDRIMPDLIKRAYETSKDLKYKETEIGKNGKLWENLFAKVKADELMEKLAKLEQSK